MVELLEERDWWIRLLALMPLAIRLQQDGVAVTELAIWMAATVAIGVAMVQVWRWTEKSQLVLSALIGGVAAGVVFLFPPSLQLIGVLSVATVFVLTCRLTIIAPLFLPNLLPGAAQSSTTNLTSTILVVGVAVFSLWVLGLASTQRGLRWNSSDHRVGAFAGLVAATGIGLVATSAALVSYPLLGEPSGTSFGYAAPSGWGISETADLRNRSERTREIVAWAMSDRPSYWRATTLDRWDGRYWTSSAATTAFLSTRSDGWAAVPEDRSGGVQLVRTRESVERIQYAIGGSTMILSRPDTVFVHLPEEAIKMRGDRSLSVSNAFDRNDQYTILSEIPVAGPDLLRQQDPVGASFSEAFVVNNLDYAALSASVVELAEEITAGQPTSYDKLLALEIWFDQNIRYNLNSPIPAEDIDPIEFMLFEDKTGYCEQVATAMALMARSQGIPARLATGFVSSERDEDGFWVIRSENAHAWVEVYFDGVGWIEFDPTDGTLPVEAEPAQPPSITSIVMGITALVSAGGALYLLVAALGFIKTKLSPGPPWIDRTIPRVYRLAHPRDDAGPDATLADCFQRLTSSGPLRGDDDVEWLLQTLTTAAYSEAEVTPADQARCDSILDTLERNQFVVASEVVAN